MLMSSSCSSKRGCCEGDLGYSKSSIESKNNGVYISNYYTPGMILKVQKYGVQLKIKEIFREHRFRIDDDNNIIKEEESQLFVILEQQVPESYYLKWKIGSFDHVYFTGGADYFDANLSRINKFDTIRFEISNARYSANENKKIGEFILIEKKTTNKN